jgi:hypothetical protein
MQLHNRNAADHAAAKLHDCCCSNMQHKSGLERRLKPYDFNQYVKAKDPADIRLRYSEALWWKLILS